MGAVMQNAATLAEIANEIKGLPVTDKYVTVNGEVANPAVFRVPIGTSILI